MIKLIIKYLKWDATTNDKFVLKRKIKNLKIIKRFNS